MTRDLTNRPTGTRLVERDLRARVHRQLVERAPTGDDTSLRSELADLLRSEAPLLADVDLDRLVQTLHDEVRGLGPLEGLLDDPATTEVMVNGADQVYVERDGRIERVSVDIDDDEIVRIVERVVAPLGLRLDRTSPIVDARLDGGSRLHAVIPPLALDGPCVTIRRFSDRSIGLDRFGCDRVSERFLHWTTQAGSNVLISGGTSSGKTTLLAALVEVVGPTDRVVTIEETAELSLRVPHVVRFEARPANAEGVGEVSVRDLVRSALRMRPDRLIVGEVRGAEALDLLQALNTGHEGSFSTVHANGPADALRRLETLARFGGELPLTAVREQIASAIDVVVQVSRAFDGRRVITEIAEVVADGSTVSALFRRPMSDRLGSSLPPLEPIAPPTRSVRRHGVEPFDSRWWT